MSNSAISTPRALFGGVRMGYAVISSRRREAWRQLLADALGMDVEAIGEAHLRCRLDERVCRILIQPGGAEDLAALGLELNGEDAHAELMARLRANDIAVEERAGEEALLRGVSRFWRFLGPKKLRIEVYYEPLAADKTLALGCSGFVTGDMGFGHMAITTKKPQKTQLFWERVFDMRYSDEVHQTIAGVPLDFTFLRFNPRHHSIALASSAGLKLDPVRTQIQHIEVQAVSLDDVTEAYRRCRALKFPISMSVGRHANDKAVSFYVKTPSGFDFEYGWNPLAVDETSWKPEVWDRISDWGHWPEDQTKLNDLGLLGTGVASLFRGEYVPALSQQR